METITFYSYKGGVGRTLALANIASYLSRFGQNVCVLDFDLEAPGLHYKLAPLFPGPVQSGLVDYIYEFIEGGTIPDSLEKYYLEADKLPAGYGHIGLIPAGNVLSAQYWKRLAAIDWHDLFYREDSEGIPFFLDFKEKIKEQVKPDYLLIDSRTGITEMGGLCTSVLTDRVVFFIGNNRENIEGARQILRGIQASPRLPDQEPVKINFVLTRIPLPAEGKGTGREEEIIKDIKKFLNEGAENLGDQLNITDITVLHSDRDLELGEGLRLTEDNLLETPLARDYLKLISKIIPEEVMQPKIQELLDTLVTPQRAIEEPEKIKSELKAIAYAYPQSGLINKLTDLFYYRLKDRPVQGDDVAVLEQYRKALQDYEKQGDNRGAAESLNQIGMIYQERGDYDAALEQYQKSLEISETEEYLPEKSVSLFQIGVIYQFKGDYDRSLGYYQQSMKIRESISDNFGISNCLNQIGIIHQKKGDYENALWNYRESLDIRKRIDDKKGISDTLHQIGIIYDIKGDYKAALEDFRKSLHIREKTGDKKRISESLHEIGIVYQQTGDYNAALLQFLQSLAIKEKIGDIRGLAKNFHQIGIIFQKKGDYPAALEQYNKSLEIKEKIGDIPGMAITFGQLGQLNESMNEFDAALKYSLKALKINEEIGSPNANLNKKDIACIREKLGEKKFQALLDRTRKELGLEKLSID